MWPKRLVFGAAIVLSLQPVSTITQAESDPRTRAATPLASTRVLTQVPSRSYHLQSSSLNLLATNHPVLLQDLAWLSTAQSRGSRWPSTAALQPGVYETRPYACIVIVRPEHFDDALVHGVGPGSPGLTMPIVKPPLRFIPRSSK